MKTTGSDPALALALALALYGDIVCYQTGETLRPATRQDWLDANKLGAPDTGAFSDYDGRMIYCTGPAFDPLDP